MPGHILAVKNPNHFIRLDTQCGRLGQQSLNSIKANQARTMFPSLVKQKQARGRRGVRLSLLFVCPYLVLEEIAPNPASGPKMYMSRYHNGYIQS